MNKFNSKNYPIYANFLNKLAKDGYQKALTDIKKKLEEDKKEKEKKQKN